MANPRMPDYKTLQAMGFSVDGNKVLTPLKDAIWRNLRIVDEQDAVTRYRWYNLPHGITDKLVERILYYRGQGCLFFSEELERFYFLPFSQKGPIDVVGRYSSVSPLPFNGSSTEEKKEGKSAFFPDVKKNPIYDVMLPDELTEEVIFDSCVILRDYTQQYSQTILPRQKLSDPILELESECLPFMNTALSMSTGISGIRVTNEDDKPQVILASQTAHYAALNGHKWLPIVGTLDFQDLTHGQVAKSEEFLVAMQSIDNFRLQLHGITNGGLFQKKAHVLESEAAMNRGTAGSVLQDGLDNRQEFCNIVNSIWGDTLLGGRYTWCEISEVAAGNDKNMDGMIGESRETNHYHQEEGEGGDSNAVL